MENTIEVPVSKRISAYLMDILLIFIMISLIIEIKFINPNYDEYVESYEKYNDVIDDYNNELITEEELVKLNTENYYAISKYSVSYNIVIVVGLILYFVVFQKFTGGQTLGKKLMKIKVVNNNNEKPTLFKLFLRCLPVYYIYIGGIIPVFINTILIYIISPNNYMSISNIVSYIFLIISIISFIILWIRKDKRGLHELISDTKVIYE